ncbi:MAG: hypothetical protein EOR00_09600 [Mesorhizobium sp.]|uniref:GP88 family protein n=1 Tax=Mesorhizobium sp. TaxID=1871066 RepID=UPI000FE9579C|nr:hypothetical protein [Mesorhizobium sp.]RWP18880.1 MAG: hypothetical protein EOR00_09600 [Mesorhizobium sp.]
MSNKIFKSKTILAGLNAKTVKGDDVYVTAIMYLAPAAQSLMGNVCPMAVMAGCEMGCLSKAGRAGIFSSIVNSRIAKTQRYFADRAAFMAELHRDIAAFVRWCAKHGVKPAVRLNGTSDIQWEVAHPVAGFKSIFEAFPEVQFYDYTKVYKRAYRSLPANYSLTLSYSEANPAYADAVLTAARETGSNIAVVYRTKALRNAEVTKSTGRFVHREVIDGDETDMRFLDPRRVVIGLYAKGPAKRDTSGFVVG